MKIKTLIATTLLLVATTALATDTKKEQESKRKLEDMRYAPTTVVETDPMNPRDPETGEKDTPDLVDGECHVMPDGYCIFW